MYIDQLTAEFNRLSICSSGLCYDCDLNDSLLLPDVSRKIYQVDEVYMSERVSSYNALTKKQRLEPFCLRVRHGLLVRLREDSARAASMDCQTGRLHSEQTEGRKSHYKSPAPISTLFLSLSYITMYAWQSSITFVTPCGDIYVPTLFIDASALLQDFEEECSCS